MSSLTLTGWCLVVIYSEMPRRPEIYDPFADTLKNFKSLVIDTLRVISGITELFCGSKSDDIPAKDRESLIDNFNNFLPPNYRIKLLLGDCTPRMVPYG